jgi:hypothetical protein
MLWWEPCLALGILLLGRFGLLPRAYRFVFGSNWCVISNGGFCRLRLAPSWRPPIRPRLARSALPSPPRLPPDGPLAPGAGMAGGDPT